MNWLGKRTEVIISEEEGKAAARAAAGEFKQKDADRELRAQERWNNPQTVERERLEALERQRADELKKQAAKTRQAENSSEGSQGYSGPSVGTLLASLFADVMAAVGRIKKDEGDNTDVADGVVMDEQLALKGPKKKVPIDPDNVVDGETWPLNEKPMEKLRRQHPVGAPKTSAGTDKKRF